MREYFLLEIAVLRDTAILPPILKFVFALCNKQGSNFNINNKKKKEKKVMKFRQAVGFVMTFFKTIHTLKL